MDLALDRLRDLLWVLVCYKRSTNMLKHARTYLQMNIQSFAAPRLPAFSVVGSILRQLYIVKAFQVYKYLGIRDVLPISFIFILDISGFWHKIQCMSWGSAYTYVGIHTLLPSTLMHTTVICTKSEQTSSPESVCEAQFFFFFFAAWM